MEALEKLLAPSAGTGPGICLPEKEPPAPKGSIRNPYEIDTGRHAAIMSVACRLISTLIGGLSPEIPGNACPAELLNIALKRQLETAVVKGSWFKMKVSGRSAEGIEFDKSIFYWDGNRISRMYDMKHGKFYNFDSSGKMQADYMI